VTETWSSFCPTVIHSASSLTGQGERNKSLEEVQVTKLLNDFHIYIKELHEEAP
jgi:hypothetical protein